MSYHEFYGHTRPPTGNQLGMSPFALTYGMEAIIPTEIGRPTLRTRIPEEANAKTVTKDLDIVDELREAIVVRIESY